MTWIGIVGFVMPIVKPLVLAGVVWLGTLISKSLLNFIQHQKYSYARTIATIAVSSVEDAYTKLDGSGKLKAAIGKVAAKVNLPANDIEDIVRAAYQATIPPLDAVKNVPLTPSTG